MYRPYGDFTSEMLEERTYFVPGLNPEQIFKSNTRAGRFMTRRVLLISLIIDCVVILAAILVSIIR